MSCAVCNGECENIEICPDHACAGDDCYCIGGRDNFDLARLADLWDNYCLARVAPMGGD